MKNYRNIVAIAIILLMIMSIYSMISGSVKDNNSLNECVSDAQALAKEGLIGKAVEKYSEAISMYPDIAYYHAITDLYYENEQIESSISWGEETIKVFPEEPSGYERLLRSYLEYTAYKDAYRTLEIADGRGVTSEGIEKYRVQMKSLHYLQYISISDVAQNSGGYLVVQKNEKWGVISSAVKTIIQPAYAQTGPFINGMIAVLDGETWYFCEEDGDYAANVSLHVKGKVTDVGGYNDECFAVCVDGKYAYYNFDFQKLSGDYEYAGTYNNGVAAVKQNGKWLIVGLDGEPISNEKYDSVVLDDRGICCLKDRIIVEKNGKYMLLNSACKRVGTATFEEAKLPSGSELIAVKQNGKWGFADLEGKIVIKPQYEDANSFSNGMAAICKNGLWGFVDEKNEICVEPIYVKCLNMTSSGTAFVLTDRGWNVLKLYSLNY